MGSAMQSTGAMELHTTTPRVQPAGAKLEKLQHNDPVDHYSFASADASALRTAAATAPQLTRRVAAGCARSSCGTSARINALFET
eukprot:COSAG02_NODE_17423_length_1004_cov_119.878453_1_plen_84_part_10